MSPIDQKTRPLKENHLIQMVLHRPVEPAPLLVMLAASFRGFRSQDLAANTKQHAGYGCLTYQGGQIRCHNSGASVVCPAEAAPIPKFLESPSADS